MDWDLILEEIMVLREAKDSIRRILLEGIEKMGTQKGGVILTEEEAKKQGLFD